jgi:Fe-S-cluster-containing dehydrogenase component
MKTTRREILKLAGVAGAAAITGVTVSATDAQASGVSTADHVGMLFDSTKCVGCLVCVRSCHDTNFLNKAYYVNQVIPPERHGPIMRQDLLPVLAPQDVDSSGLPKFNPVANDYRFKNVIQKYVDEENSAHFVKRQCMHCNHPGCVSACPLKAMTKNQKDGVVEYDAGICIGCRYCQVACPFNVPSFEWHRAIPKITKCGMCKDTLWNDAASGRKQQTACTRDCPVQAVIFGKSGDLLAEAKKRLRENPDRYNPEIYGEHVYGGTNVIYLIQAGVTPANLGFPAQLGTENYAKKSDTLQNTIYKWGIAPLALYGAVA